MRKSLNIISASVVLLGLFCVDLCTPQALVVAILLSVPVVIAALTRSLVVTTLFVIAALCFDTSAAVVDAAREHWNWDVYDLSNRFLAGISIVLVGALCTTMQERARRFGAMSAKENRMRREVVMAAAIDRMRTSLSRDLVDRAIPREAITLFRAPGVMWITAERGHPTFSAHVNDPESIDERNSDAPEIASLIQSVLDGGKPRAVARSDAFGRLLLDRFGWESATVLPVREHDKVFGVLVLCYTGDREIEDDEVSAARAFARAVGTTLVRTELFATLAERNETVAERNAVIRDLVFALTHDLRTPLSALGMTMRQTRDGAYGELPDLYRRVLDTSIEAIDDLQRLAETLLTVARFESGEQRNARDPVDLADLTARVLTEFEAFAFSRDITLTAHDMPPTVTTGDSGDLRRAITNLVANALEHTPPDGTVEVSLTTAGGYATLTVNDDGYGIPQEHRETLFTRFTPAAARGGGSGLGLYIVRRIVEEMGGSVAYTPRTPRGSAFSLTVPTVTP